MYRDGWLNLLTYINHTVCNWRKTYFLGSFSQGLDRPAIFRHVTKCAFENFYPQITEYRVSLSHKKLSYDYFKDVI
jgi:hypothetical protein